LGSASSPVISEATSKLYNRIDEALDELAGRLVGEILDSGMNDLERVKEGIHDEMRSRLLTWAEGYVR
jgi:hypothetical protein